MLSVSGEPRVDGSVFNKGKDKELLLIGTVHRDPEGAARLRRLLAREGPVAVAVEVSPFGLYYRHRFGRRLRRRLSRKLRRATADSGKSWDTWGQIQAVLAQLLVPFEYRAALQHSRDTGAALSCLDSSSWSKRWIHYHWQKLHSNENVVALLEQSPQNFNEEIRSSYQLAARLLEERGQVAASALIEPLIGDSDWQQREAELADKLQRMHGGLREGRLVYVGGWEHLLNTSSAGTLYDRLKHLQPRRALLARCGI